ncbi:hypothetical protein ACHHYP_09341 [Achlya hypogyna]|uniref:Little elongation complex subunit 2 C-terminal domain-containing protein n=1 Tax=Achlya hypogyna TaxID=1202772 RepID=A0A1V9YNK5_ACHHY|nr:hypothetical protein ACHHYP_09341 [Achlya hypogyna]
MKVPMPRGATDGAWLSAEEYDFFSATGSVYAAFSLSVKAPAKVPAKPQVTTDVKLKLPELPTSCLDNVMHQRKTNLTPMDHAMYLELSKKKVNALQRGFPDLLALSDAERETWATLHPIVTSEQRDFRKQFEAEARRDLFVLTALPESIEKAIDIFLQARCAAAIELYPAAYTRVSSISLKTTTVAFQAPKHLARVGPPAPTAPPLRRPFPAPQSKLDPTSVSWTTGTVLSQDPVGLQILQTQQCDVAIAASTLSLLFDNEGDRFRKEWMIPVVVREGPKKHRQSQVVFDKPLVGSTWSGRQKLTLFARKLVKAAVAAPVAKRSYDYHTWTFGTKKVLVRTQNHAMDAESNRPVSIHGKVDYEWSTTHEQLSDSERARFWLQSWLRGNAGIVLGRVNGSGTTVLKVSDESIASVAPTLESPFSKFATVVDVFDHMGELPLGQYVLSYAASFNGIHVYAAGDGGEPLLDLHARLASAGVWDRTKLDWVLPEWELEGQVPYTFVMPTYCKSYAESNGTCARIAKGSRCGNVHLRLDQSRAGMYIVQSCTGTTIKRDQPARRPRFPYCKPALFGKCLQKDCELPHLSHHSFLFALAREYVDSTTQRRMKPAAGDEASTAEGLPARTARGGKRKRKMAT